MPTHFHLLVSLPEVGRFSQALQWLKWEYTVRHNRRRRRTGPLWRERFKSQLIEDETYLHACGRYVEENPLKAGLVEKASDWPHSSSAHYEGLKEDPLVDRYHFDGTLETFPRLDEEAFTQGPGIRRDLE